MTVSNSPSDRSSSRPHPSAIPPSAFAAEPPARAVFRPLASIGPWAPFDCESLELISRGDIVNGLRIRARRQSNGGSDASSRGAAAAELPGAGPVIPAARSALLLLAHDAGESTQAPDWSAVSPWVARGLDVVAIDLPLQGRRASAKLSERLVGAVASLARGETLDRNGRLLVDEFRRQAVCDLARTRDALIATGAYDPDRVGLLALGLGAWVAEALLESTSRFAAAALVTTEHAPAPSTRVGGTERSHFVVIAGTSLATGHAAHRTADAERAAWAAPAERVLSLGLGL